MSQRRLLTTHTYVYALHLTAVLVLLIQRKRINRWTTPRGLPTVPHPSSTSTAITSIACHLPSSILFYSKRAMQTQSNVETAAILVHKGRRPNFVTEVVARCLLLDFSSESFRLTWEQRQKPTWQRTSFRQFPPKMSTHSRPIQRKRHTFNVTLRQLKSRKVWITSPDDFSSGETWTLLMFVYCSRRYPQTKIHFNDWYPSQSRLFSLSLERIRQPETLVFVGVGLVVAFN